MANLLALGGSIIGGGGNSIDASNVNYNNTTSGLLSTNAQSAIDEVNGKFSTLSANNISYGNGTVKSTLDGLVGSLITLEDQARFGLPSTDQSLNNQTMADVNGTWTIVSSDYYTASNNVLTIRTSGMYIITLSGHGYVNADSFIELMALVGQVAPAFTVMPGIHAGAMQGRGSGIDIRYLEAGTTVKMQAYTNNLSNYLYGSSVSMHNWILITKLS